MHSKHCPALLLGLCVWGATASSRAADAYYHVVTTAVTLTEGEWPSTEVLTWQEWQMGPVFAPRVLLDGPGEGYVVGHALTPPWMAGEEDNQDRALVLRAPEGADVTGRILMPKPKLDGMTVLRFKLPATAASPEARARFFEAQEQHYRRLLDRGLPGAAWFRHQARLASEQAGNTNRVGTRPEDRFPGEPRDTDLERTFDLFTGGRAISENLQLDRALITGTAESTTVPVQLSSLEGITVQEMNWKPLLTDPPAEPDPLASAIPADQHALFFPSFEAMTRMMDEAETNGTPVLQWLEPRSEDADVRGRYQQQLCLEVSALSRALGPVVIRTMAFTGSDPFLRAGTDVAVLFDARNPAVLNTHLLARHTAARATRPGIEAVSGEIEGVKFTGVVSPDHAVSSYTATVSNLVVVANSKHQLAAVLRTARGGAASLASQDEYRYFRQRYPRSATNETAFAILSDATIRRWCGPRWRIADSRRTRVAAVLAELQATHLDTFAAGGATGQVVTTAFSPPGAGEFRLTPAGAASSVYGTADFLTPIAELPITEVTLAEADAYRSWRESYQRNWRRFFDPIAVRFSLSGQRLAADLIVMPLIAATDYRTFLEYTVGATLEPGAGDPHTNAVARLGLSINTSTDRFREAGNFLGNMVPALRANPLGWVGSSLTLYADDDPFWDALMEAKDLDEHLEKNWSALPVALHVAIRNPLGAAAFLTAIRAYSDQAAPGMAVWQNLEYNGRTYVKIGSTPQSRPDADRDWAIFYAVTPGGLTLTLNEPLLKRALDRQPAAGATEVPAAPPAQRWLGGNLGLMGGEKLFRVLDRLSHDEYQKRLQMLAWGNLPILNEWKRLHAGRDPVAFHQLFWGMKLLCPGGGSYVWNEPWQTMESTVFGHPGAPKSGGATPLTRLGEFNVGLTFENQGLSASAVLERKAP